MEGLFDCTAVFDCCVHTGFRFIPPTFRTDPVCDQLQSAEAVMWHRACLWCRPVFCPDRGPAELLRSSTVDVVIATWRQPKKANVDGQGKDFSEFNTRLLIHTVNSKHASPTAVFYRSLPGLGVE